MQSISKQLSVFLLESRPVPISPNSVPLTPHCRTLPRQQLGFLLRSHFLLVVLFPRHLQLPCVRAVHVLPSLLHTHVLFHFQLLSCWRCRRGGPKLCECCTSALSHFSSPSTACISAAGGRCHSPVWAFWGGFVLCVLCTTAVLCCEEVKLNGGLWSRLEF